MTPAWLKRLIKDTESYAVEMAYGGQAADFLTDARMAWTREQDRLHPDRPCAWCFSPRNGEECNFAKGHPPYVESFSGE